MVVRAEAVSKGRPRASKHGHMYTPTRTREYENKIRKSAEKLAPVVGDYPVQLDVTILTKPPKNWPKWKKEAAELGLIFPQRGDTDNKYKAIADALNGVVYLDDNLIPEISARQHFGDDHIIVVRVYQIGVSLEAVTMHKHNLKALEHDLNKGSP